MKTSDLSAAANESRKTNALDESPDCITAALGIGGAPDIKLPAARSSNRVDEEAVPIFLALILASSLPELARFASHWMTDRPEAGSAAALLAVGSTVAAIIAPILLSRLQPTTLFVVATGFFIIPASVRSARGRCQIP